jgi:hypothetical protein
MNATLTRARNATNVMDHPVPTQEEHVPDPAAALPPLDRRLLSHVLAGEVVGTPGTGFVVVIATVVSGMR